MLIFELSRPGRRGAVPSSLKAGGASEIPRGQLRAQPPRLPEVSELDALRHYTRLSQRNFSIDTHFYPLGSCTMKYNPRACNALALLPQFLALWVGARYDAGTLSTVLVCVMVLQLGLFRVDSNVIDVTLRVRAKVLLGLASAVMSIALAILLVGPAGLGIPGLVIGIVVGRLPLSVAYPWLVGRLLRVPLSRQVRAVPRPLVTTVLLFTGAVLLRPHVRPDGWLDLTVLAAAATAAALVLAGGAGLSRAQRRQVRVRAMRVVGRG